MYDKDEDDYNVGAEWRMAREVFKEAPRRGVANRHYPVTNPIIKPLIHTRVDEGAKEFSGHEDVIKKFLGGID